MILQLSVEECKNEFRHSLEAGLALHAGNFETGNCESRISAVAEALSRDSPAILGDLPVSQADIDSFLDHFVVQWIEAIERGIQENGENARADVTESTPAIERNSKGAPSKRGPGKIIEFSRPEESRFKRAAEKPPRIVLGRQIRVSEWAFAITNAVLFAASAFGDFAAGIPSLGTFGFAAALMGSVSDFLKRGKLEGTELCVFVKSLIYVGDGMFFTPKSVKSYWFSAAGQPCNLPAERKAWWCWRCPERYDGSCQFRSSEPRFNTKIDDDLGNLVKKKYLSYSSNGYCVST